MHVQSLLKIINSGPLEESQRVLLWFCDMYEYPLKNNNYLILWRFMSSIWSTKSIYLLFYTLILILLLSLSNVPNAGLSANLVPRVCHFRPWPLAIASTGKIMMIDIERLLREIKPVLHPLRMQEIHYANTYFSVKFQQKSAPLFFIRFKKKEYAKTVAGV